MPRFPGSFGRRKSAADNLENAPVTGSSFRVLERSEVAGVKSFDGGVSLAGKTNTLPRTHALAKKNGSDVSIKDTNIFADLKSNRGSGSSNVTKTTFTTDDSSRNSNSSTAPSSADTSGHEEWRNMQRRLPVDIPVPPIPKSSSNGFLRAAGRTFSFGGPKKPLPSVPAVEDSPPPTPRVPELRQTPPAPGRSRATTSSTTTTVTPPRVDGDFDLGGDFGKMLLGGDKRASMATLKDDQNAGMALGARSLTGARLNQPSPIQIDKTTKVEPSPYSWSSHHSNEQLLVSSSPSVTIPLNENVPPPVPRHSSPLAGKQLRPSLSPKMDHKKPLLGRQLSHAEFGDGEDEEARLLRDSLSTVTRFMSGSSAGQPSSSSASRYRRNEDGSAISSTNAPKGDDDSLFDTSHAYSLKSANRYTPRKSSPHQGNKVMTPAQFEEYRKNHERLEKERQEDSYRSKVRDNDDDDDDNYEDDEDDLQKAKEAAKQRRKQEAHLSVYRQKMMKVTGESAANGLNGSSSRPSLQISLSTPNLPNLSSGTSPGAGASENSDEDEEVPLAILAAHGFPGKNRPPTRLSTMMSNPNLRAAQQPSYQRPGSVVGDPSGPGGARLPAFARNLPQDPFLGAGLVRPSVRESFAFGGGSAAPGQPSTPGGLIGVIASEERSRAMRRGSPHLDGQNQMPGPGAGFDPIAGIPAHMMYQNSGGTPMVLTPGDQAQMQMTQQMQQMQQFMQMQMHFMQMMAGQNGNAPPGPNGQMTAQQLANMGPMGGMPGAGGILPPLQMGGPEIRHSFMGSDSMLDLPSARGDAQFRTMSMVQPSSASWIQQPQNPGIMPSILIQGAGYTPSIAPSERSNVGLPPRYRPVSQAPLPLPVGTGHLRKSSTMSGALQSSVSVTKLGNTSDDDDEEGWEALKAKREKKKSMWRSKKNVGGGIGAFIS
ncbi:hypothetical protein B0H63DRAFT_48837 [Podospora didyma]|uniref:Uncharacterized protein n=1 Tax=Podospora didyma TaxID=330526 RepID=A0AAE0U845_9PEZI|nr:hypothetical protein B0H63DRAFT_48837 [Podospora didyma]